MTADMGIQAGDPREARLAEIFCRAGPGLFRYAAAILGNREEAEEVVADVFARLAERRDRTWPVAPDGYLLRAIRNESWKRLQRDRRRREILTERANVLIPRSPGDPADSLLAADASRVLAALPPEQREVVALHIFEGLSFEAIGHVAGVPANTAMSRYRYGLEKMRKAMSQ